MANQNTISLNLVVNDDGSVTIKQFGQNTENAMKTAGSTTKSAGGDMESAFSRIASSAMETGTALLAALNIQALLIKVKDLIVGTFTKGFEAVDSFSKSIATMAAMVVTFAERAEGVTIAEQWEKSLRYSTALVPILENIAAKTLLSGQETTALANAFARSGVFLDASNAKQIESFTRISNALPMMTEGQDIMRQINTEVRSVMTGANEQSSMFLITLKAIDPQIEAHLKTWRAEGTVLEHIGDLLTGFGPATALYEIQWQAVKSTIDTTVTQVLRGGMQVTYAEIINNVQSLNTFLQEQKGTLAGGISVAWSAVSNIVGAVWGVLKGFGPLLGDVANLVGTIAYGWGGIAAVLKPIGELIGNQIAFTYELVKMIGNAAQAAFALATGNVSGAKIFWEDAKNNYNEANSLAQKSGKIVTDGILDSIAKYDLQTKAAVSGAQTSSDASQQFIAKKIEDEKTATANAKLQYETEKDLAKDYYKNIENSIKTQEAILKASGASEIDINKATKAAKEAYINDYYAKEKSLITLSATARSTDDAAKVKSAAFIAEKLKALDSDVALKRQELTDQTSIAEAKAQGEAVKLIFEEAEAGSKATAKMLETRQKASKDYIALIAAANEKIGTAQENAITKILNDENTALEKLGDLWATGALTYEQVETARALIAEGTEAAIVESANKSTLQRQQAERDLYKDIQGYAQQGYEAQVGLIMDQAEKYAKLGVDEVAIVAWVEQETTKAEIKKGKAGDDFFAGMNAGMQEMKLNAETWGKAGADAYATLYKSMGSSFGSLFKDVVTGDLASLDTYGKKIFDSVLTNYTNSLGEMASKSILEQLQPGLNLVQSGFSTAWGVVKDGYHSVVSDLGGVSITDSIKNNWASFTDYFSGDDSVMAAVGDGYGEEISGMGGVSIWDSVKGMWDSFASYFIGDDSVLSAVGSGYGEEISGMGGVSIWGSVKNMWGTFTSYFTGKDNVLAAVGDGYGEEISGMGGVSIWDSIKGMWDSFASYFTGDDSVLSAVGSGYGEEISGIGGVSIWDSVKGMWGTFTSYFTGDDSIFSSIKSGYNSAIELLKNTDVLGAIKSSWDTVWTFFSTNFTSIYNSIVSIGSAIAGMASKAYDWLSAETGMWSVPGNAPGAENGAVPIIAHEGEMILNKGLAKEVRDALTSSGTSNLTFGGKTVAGLGGVIGGIIGAYFGNEVGGKTGAQIGGIGGSIAGVYGGAALADYAGLTYGDVAASIAAEDAALGASMSASSSAAGAGVGMEAGAGAMPAGLGAYAAAGWIAGTYLGDLINDMWGKTSTSQWVRHYAGLPSFEDVYAAYQAGTAIGNASAEENQIYQIYYRAPLPANMRLTQPWMGLSEADRAGVTFELAQIFPDYVARTDVRQITTRYETQGAIARMFGSGGLATSPSIFGDAGAEWAVPTYEPQRSNFLNSAPASFWDNLRGGQKTKEKSGGNGDGSDNEFHFHFHGTLIDRTAVNEFAEMIYPRLKRLEAWGH